MQWKQPSTMTTPGDVWAGHYWQDKSTVSLLSPEGTTSDRMIDAPMFLKLGCKNVRKRKETMLSRYSFPVLKLPLGWMKAFLTTWRNSFGIAGQVPAFTLQGLMLNSGRQSMAADLDKAWECSVLCGTNSQNVYAYDSRKLRTPVSTSHCFLWHHLFPIPT